MSKTLHLNTIGKDEWLTPPEIIRSLGEFDLDPCSPVNRPWSTAKQHFTVDDNGLIKDWFGRVWLNPPYGNQLEFWMNKMCLHGDGIAMTFARTQNEVFHQYVWPLADSIFFFRQYVHFYHVNGQVGGSPGAPSVLIAYGDQNSEAIAAAGLRGHHVPLNRIGVIVIGLDSTWRVIVKQVMVRINRPAELDELYEEVARIADDRIKTNRHYKAKIRQVLQKHFTRVKRGVYSN